jgi:hypothetical protein
VSNRPQRRAVKRGVLMGAALGMVAASSASHAQELWLVPDVFALASGSSTAATARVAARGARDRAPLRPAVIADVRLLGSAGEARLGDIAPDGASLRVRYRPRRLGQYVLAVALNPRSARTTQTQFVKWLRAQAADSEAARLEREPPFAPTDSVTYRSVSYATAIIDVGSGPRAFERATGFPIDIIPLLDPANAAAGDTLAFRLAIEGNPLSGLLVRVGLVRDPSRLAPSASLPTGRDYQTRTDHDGVLRVPIPRAGVWGLSTTRVVLLASPGPSGPEPGFWDVTWATHVFNVAPRRTP